MNRHQTRISSTTLLLAGLFLASAATAADPSDYARFDPQVKPVLARMTLDEKIGQMLQPDEGSLKDLDDIDRYHLGSVLSGGDTDPKTGNDFASWSKLYETIQGRAMKTRLHIPLLYGVDSIHGMSNIEGATLFPHNVGLGCTRDEALEERIGRVTAEETKATGIQWAFSPCVTVPQDIRWGRSYEGFSQDPEIVKMMGAAYVRGLQTSNLKSPDAVVASVKHAAGDGGTVWGTGIRDEMDHGDTQVDEATFRRIHLPGYVTAIKAGAGTIMPSYSMWNGVRCSANKHLLTDILKNDFGFQGFLISDYNAIDEIPASSYKEKVRISVMAGMDMFMVTEKYPQVFENLKQLVQSGDVPMSRIDDAVTRILRVKAAMGMLDSNWSPTPDPALVASFGSAEHRAVARQAVRESLVLLKNGNHVLPLSKTARRIHFAGKSADDLGDQNGGWTIFWQGHSGRFTRGTTVLDAAKKAVGPNTMITYSADGTNAQYADAAVLVIGEKPYAEMFGDRTIQQLHLSPEDKAALANLKKSGIPTAVVLFSGRPILIDDVMDQADAWVAAWLPGSEGEGVTDVLFGDYKPTGKLSFSWPKSSSTSLHIGDPGYATMFDLGYGLSY